MLIFHGILNEQSDVRVHVCKASKSIYIFSTEEGVKQVLSGKFKKASAFQGEQKTAHGFLVPPCCISGLEKFKIDEELWRVHKFEKLQGESAKGEMAQNFFIETLKRKMIKSRHLGNLKRIRFTNKDEQLSGIDLIGIRSDGAEVRIQIKCDLNGGEGGTGNLFLQTEESNPWKKI